MPNANVTTEGNQDGGSGKVWVFLKGFIRTVDVRGGKKHSQVQETIRKQMKGFLEPY